MRGLTSIGATTVGATLRDGVVSVCALRGWGRLSVAWLGADAVVVVVWGKLSGSGLGALGADAVVALGASCWLSGGVDRANLRVAMGADAVEVVRDLGGSGAGRGTVKSNGVVGVFLAVLLVLVAVADAVVLALGRSGRALPCASTCCTSGCSRWQCCLIASVVDALN